MNKFDLIVIGGGPGGYVAAIRAAQLGAKVALIEKDQVGGTCLNRGCIPTKALIASSSFYTKVQKADNFGITTGEVKLDWPKVIERKNKIVAKLVKGVEQLLKGNGVEVIAGEGKVLEPGKVEVVQPDSGKLLVVSRKLILAMGSSPACLPGIKFDQKNILSSDDLLNLSEPPAKLDIVGGGVIGLHFAQIYSALGTKITIHEALPEILPGVDDEIVALIKRILKRKGIEVLTGARFDPASAKSPALICVGRTPNSANGKSLPVNEYLETKDPGVYAVGDLVSRKMLAHVAYEQGAIAAENALGAKRSFSYDHVPYTIYTDPEIGGVGLTENEARKVHNDIKVGKFPFGALGISQALGEIEGFIKVVASEAGALLGVHIIGPEASTLIGQATLALNNHLSVEQLAETFQAHPSYPEGLQEASLNALQRAIHIL
jgi:dihydrolipoamide dehydrogenase